ncbi:MAG TPA: hypothetical protein VHE30_06915 [Polyangiaceae bacterium]|nr:hypothetical protein [Polyangiaceae bacterium]
MVRTRISRFVPRAVSAATLAIAMFLAMPAHAGEGWVIDGSAGLGTGLEGGDPGTGKTAWRRARTRIIGGLDLHTDENSSDGMGFRAFAEIEGRGSVGGEARYVRWITPRFGAFAGLTGTLAPETLFGGGFGARLSIPLGKRVGLYLEPSFYALPVGSDLPGKSVLLWGLFAVGVHFGL